MSVNNFPFGGGVDEVFPYGQKNLVVFDGTWETGESWTIAGTSTEGDFIVGLGRWETEPTCCFTLKTRVYVGIGNKFIFSDNDGPTNWEQQYEGAGSQPYNSQIGKADTVQAFSQLQGRLAVFGRYSIQLWTVDADPALFAVVQNLENTGTKDALSPMNVGDYDVLYLSECGVRSLRTKEITQNAGIEDLGSPVDSLVLADSAVPGRLCCAAFNPKGPHYWLFINEDIYVYANHPSSKVQAWTKYKTVDDQGDGFSPEKFVLYNGVIFCRAVGRGLYIHGGSDGDLYDGSIVWAETPWHENRLPLTLKGAQGIGAIFSGPWQVWGSMDPRTDTPPELLVTYGDPANPQAQKDSALGLGTIPFYTQGTHYMFRMKSSPDCTKKQNFSAIMFKDQKGNII